MKKVLLTGAAGFLGSNTVDELLRQNYQVKGIDNLSTGNMNNIKTSLSNPAFTFSKTDVNDYDKMFDIFKDFKPNYVFHYAAVVGVQRTLEKPLDVLADIEGFKNVCNLSTKFRIERLLYSSSSEVYGEPVEVPLKETSPLNAILPYAVVKNVGEKFLESYNQELNLPYTIFRFFNVYGPRQRTDFVISKFINSALKKEPLTVYGDGQQYRTYLFVSDNVKACVSSLDGDYAVNKTINVGGKTKVSANELAKLVIDFTNSNSLIVHKPALEKGDMLRREPCLDRMGYLINMDSLVPFEVGLRKTIKWFK